jgi:hypothetical protein
MEDLKFRRRTFRARGKRWLQHRAGRAAGQRKRQRAPRAVVQLLYSKDPTQAQHYQLELSPQPSNCDRLAANSLMMTGTRSFMVCGSLNAKRTIDRSRSGVPKQIATPRIESLLGRSAWYAAARQL